MFKYCIALSLLFVTNTSYSQNLTLADLPTELYKELPVKFNFSMSNIPCNGISFKVNNGIVKQQKCSIWIKPDSVGICELIVLDNKGKHIAEYIFAVKEKPVLKGFLGVKGGGTIKKDEILLVGGLIALMDKFDIDIPILTISYTLQVIRNSETLCQITNNGARYESKTVDLIKSLKKDDLLIIYSITALVNEKTVMVQPMEFKIDETS